MSLESFMLKEEIKEVEYYREYSDNNKKRMFKKSI